MAALGFLGPEGTHSEEAALYLNGLRQEKWRLVPYPSIYEAIQAVADGEIERCLVPVENSIEGDINITLDTLAHKVDLEVEQELIWPVHNQLLVKDPKQEIGLILSHAQPLAQCREYIKLHYKGVEIRQVASTARAAEIQDDKTNCTRFFLLRQPAAGKPAHADKTFLVCRIDGQAAGSLCEVLLEFASRNINMTRIESRPAKTGLGIYVFFFELDATAPAGDIEAAIEAVRAKSLWLKNLGSFPVIEADCKK